MQVARSSKINSSATMVRLAPRNVLMPRVAIKRHGLRVWHAHICGMVAPWSSTCWKSRSASRSKHQMCCALVKLCIGMSFCSLHDLCTAMLVLDPCNPRHRHPGFCITRTVLHVVTDDDIYPNRLPVACRIQALCHRSQLSDAPVVTARTHLRGKKVCLDVVRHMLRTLCELPTQYT